jgi:glycosyltransferase involved in cell wall biosynthesis
MKVCFVCSEYPPGLYGGIGRVTQVLARALVRAGHEVRVAGMYPPSTTLPEYEEDKGVRVWRMRARSGKLRWIGDRHNLYTKVRSWCADGLVELIELPDWDGLAAYWPSLEVPVLTRVHGSMTYFAAELGKRVRPMSRLLERESLKRADFWCSVTQHVAQVTQNVFHIDTGPDAILYNPVEIPADVVSRWRDPNRVVFTGTLARKKGVVSLVEAWAKVKRQHPDAQLHLFGKDGRTDHGVPMTRYLISLMDQQTAESVHFHGHVSHETIQQNLLNARLAVFPSYSESFGLAPIEAMACGCPTIFTKRTCGPEVLQDGVEGILVDPDDPSEIADAILRLLRDDSLAETLARRGFAGVTERFSLDRLLPRNEEYYQTCLDEFQARSDGRSSRRRL